jgi:hypothetical protein
MRRSFLAPLVVTEDVDCSVPDHVVLFRGSRLKRTDQARQSERQRGEEEGLKYKSKTEASPYSCEGHGGATASLDEEKRGRGRRAVGCG